MFGRVLNLDLRINKKDLSGATLHSYKPLHKSHTDYSASQQHRQSSVCTQFQSEYVVAPRFELLISL